MCVFFLNIHLYKLFSFTSPTAFRKAQERSSKYILYITIKYRSVYIIENEDTQYNDGRHETTHYNKTIYKCITKSSPIFRPLMH